MSEVISLFFTFKNYIFQPLPTGLVNYIVESNMDSSVQSIQVTILDKEGTPVGQSNQKQGQITVHNANLWWPYSMARSANSTAYLYTFQVSTIFQKAQLTRLKKGHRLKVNWNVPAIQLTARSLNGDWNATENHLSCHHSVAIQSNKWWDFFPVTHLVW